MDVDVDVCIHCIHSCDPTRRDATSTSLRKSLKKVLVHVHLKIQSIYLSINLSIYACVGTQTVRDGGSSLRKSYVVRRVSGPSHARENEDQNEGSGASSRKSHSNAGRTPNPLTPSTAKHL